VIRVGLASVIVVLFAYSGWRSLAWWRGYRDVRALRNFMNSIALLAGSLALWLSIWVIDFVPDRVGWGLEVVTWAGLMILLTVGAANVISWRRDR